MDPKSGIDNRWDFEASGVNLTGADPSLRRFWVGFSNNFEVVKIKALDYKHVTWGMLFQKMCNIIGWIIHLVLFSSTKVGT